MEQEQQQRRDNIVDRLNNAYSSYRTFRSLGRLGRSGIGIARGATPLFANPYVLVGVLVVIIIFVFIIVLTGGPSGTGSQLSGTTPPPGTTTGLAPPGSGSTGTNPPQSVNPPPIPGGHCIVGSGPCSVDNLRGYFGENAQTASVICQRESGSNSSALNNACLRGGTADYSAGLFQINLLAHCPGAFTYALNPPSCQVIDDSRRLECLERLRDPDVNIREAVRISGGGAGWSAWGAARACGIINR